MTAITLLTGALTAGRAWGIPSTEPAYACPQPESYPPAGTPRSADGAPYAIPFAGTVNDGVLTVGPASALKAVLGPANADVCGVFQLATKSAMVPSDQFRVTDNPVPASLDVMGLQVFEVYLDLSATATVQLEPEPAANGGLQLLLTASFDATLVPSVNVLGLLGPSGLQIPLSAAECTAHAGPIVFTTGRSGSLQGQPVTGPIGAGSARVVANDFVFPAIDPATPPAPSASAGDSCAPAVADLFNSLLQLPAPAGNATFTAGATFSLRASA